jgi:hypothetical protein
MGDTLTTYTYKVGGLDMVLGVEKQRQNNNFQKPPIHEFLNCFTNRWIYYSYYTNFYLY